MKHTRTHRHTHKIVKHSDHWNSIQKKKQFSLVLNSVLSCGKDRARPPVRAGSVGLARVRASRAKIYHHKGLNNGEILVLD